MRKKLHFYSQSSSYSTRYPTLKFLCRYTPRHNGIAERKNRGLLEVVWSLYFQLKFLNIFGVKLFSQLPTFINRMPFRVLNFQTPCKDNLAVIPSYKVRQSSFLILKYLVAFKIIVSLGLYRVFFTSKELQVLSSCNQKLYNSTDVTFFENHAYYKSELQGENTNKSHLQDFIQVPMLNL